MNHDEQIAEGRRLEAAKITTAVISAAVFDQPGEPFPASPVAPMSPRAAAALLRVLD